MTTSRSDSPAELTALKRWDNESGDWRHLDNTNQQPRYEAIKNQIERFDAKTVLDVGCGEGLLRHFMPPAVARYLGLEPSTLAAASAQSSKIPVLNTTAEDFTPNSPWDCIVFNEVLYYLKDPVGVLRKYASAVTPTGIVIVSIFQRQGRPAIKDVIGHWLDRRRPISNIHCTQMVLQFFDSEKWSIHSDEQVSTVAGNARWRLISARPNQAQASRDAA